MSTGPDFEQIAASHRVVAALSAAVWVQRALHVAVQLGVLDMVATGPSSASAVAAATGSDTDALGRVLRLLAAEGYLEELDDGRFGLTSLGRCLLKDSPLSARWLMLDDATYDAAGAMLYSVRTGSPAFDRVHGIDFWAHLDADAEAAERFHAKMSVQALLLCLPALSALPWDEVRTVVDVGGGSGTLLGHVLAQHRHLSGLVVDRPHAQSRAQATLRSLGVADRADFRPFDFRTESPPAADVVLLSRVLHDWDDPSALALLRRIRPAIHDGARLIVLEMVAPDGNAPHPSRITDVNLLVLLGGAHERTAGQLARLLGDAGFEVRGTYDSPTAVVATEAVAATYRDDQEML